MQQRHRRSDTSVGHHDVQGAVLGDRGIDEALDLLLVTDVAGMCGGAGDVLGDLPGCGLVDVGHHDGGAGLAEALGDGLAETLACAGDDGDLALEFCGHAMTP